MFTLLYKCSHCFTFVSIPAFTPSTRDARDRLMNGVDGSKEKEKKKVVELEKPISIWTPSFQPEDFMEDAHSRNPPINSAGPSKRGRKNKEEEESNGLDLKLSL
ncbi:hypothetical protein HHK36_014800 [Tetracentron sinense]|uniref:Uncharacterized protein n=1 Tax=Tetracentron sinense TaxID=13715 RepID=A0A834Z3I7_TETSI|nr:hypothetical protein HHK36_014800 [Tetracentron sinense]